MHKGGYRAQCGRTDQGEERSETNITQFIKHLNKTKGWSIRAECYAAIGEWKSWWLGEVPAFHRLREAGLDGNIHEREMYRMRMPKRVCEDWASLLLNDKTTVTVDDAAAARWLLGEDAQQTGGALGQMGFWPGANRLVELAFRSGTGAFVMSVEGLQVQGGQAVPSPGARVCMDWLPAECILPVTVRRGEVVDVAFASEVLEKGAPCVYLQTHRLVKRGGADVYEIRNEYFTAEEHSGETEFRPAPLPAGMAAGFITGTDRPWFALLSPNLLSTLPGANGMGMAVFAEALDQARQCDLAFDNYCRDLFLGGKKVVYNRAMMKAFKGPDGEMHMAAPDQVRQQLFMQPEGDPDEADAWHEYNPDLRVNDNGQAVQDALNYFSFKCGLGCHHYQFTGSTIATATQYTGERQDMVQHANRHQIPIEAAMLRILRAVLWAGRALLGEALDEECAMTVNFDDSYITDSETRRARMKEDVRDKIYPAWRYLAEWYGMDEEEARAAVAEAAGEGASDEALGFGDG